MHRDPRLAAAIAATLLSSLLCGTSVAQSPPASGDKPPLDVPQLFATTCGWCHSDGGRAAGKGPQLMGTARSDDFIRTRIKNGKEGAMPAFNGVLSDEDIDAVIRYIRTLKPDT